MGVRWLVLGGFMALAFLAATAVRVNEWRNRPIFTFIPNDIQVTIPEGSNLAEIETIFVENHMASAGMLLTPEYLVLEGKLFPDTYRIDRGSTADTIIKKLRDTYERRTAEFAVDKDILIIASMLEKEVQTS